MTDQKHLYMRKINEKIFNGRYSVVKVLADKGMSYVYVCMDLNLNKLVCLKEIVKANAGRDQVFYTSIMNEAEILAKISYPGIPRIIDRKEDDERVSIFMDFISGENCEELVQRQGPLDESFVISKMTQLAIILGHLHNLAFPVFYRDLKPSNVLLQDGEVKLLDFGISVRLDSEHRIIKQPLGTKGYASPEQSKVGEPYDLRSDIYSFGATMFTLLSGLSPLKTEDMDIRKYRPEISMGLANVLSKCVEEDPDDRFQTIEEVLAALKNYRMFDKQFTKQSKSKVRTVYSLIGLGIVTSLIAGGVYYAGIVDKQNQYDYLLSKAENTGEISDYQEAIDAEPSKIQPYFDVLTQIKSGDAIFDDEEEKVLLNIINTDGNEIRDNDRYPEFAYEVGILYWFFYQSESNASGQSLSTKWFKESENGDYQVDQSRAFYNMGMFNRDIASSIQTATDSGMYKKYWDTLTNLKVDDASDVMTLQLYNYILDCVNNYTFRLKTDGITRDQIRREVDKINNYINNHGTPVPGRPTELTNDLKDKIAKSGGLVDAVYEEVQ